MITIKRTHISSRLERRGFSMNIENTTNMPTTPDDIKTKIAVLKDIFKNDPLHMEIIRLGLDDELYAPDDFYEQLKFGMDYSTKQAAEILGIKGKEQTLINYLNRDDFKPYFQIFRTGSRGYYRYNHKTLFQFKMIFLLNKHGKQPSDIATILGTRVDYIEEFHKPRFTKHNTNTPADNVKNEIKNYIQEQLGEMLTHVSRVNEQILSHLEKKQKLENLLKELNLWETEIRNIVGRIEDIELNKSIYELIIKTHTKKRGFFSKLFGSALTEEELNNYKIKLDQLEQRYKELLAKKEKLDSQKETLLKAIQNAEKELLEEYKFIEENKNTKFLPED